MFCTRSLVQYTVHVNLLCCKQVKFRILINLFWQYLQILSTRPPLPPEKMLHFCFSLKTILSIFCCLFKLSLHSCKHWFRSYSGQVPADQFDSTGSASQQIYLSTGSTNREASRSCLTAPAHSATLQRQLVEPQPGIAEPRASDKRFTSWWFTLYFCKCFQKIN